MAISRSARIALLSVAAILAVLAIAASIAASRLQPWARHLVVESLRDRFQADVDLGDLKLSLLPVIRIEGQNLSIHPRNGAPLIRIRHFTGSASFWGLLRTPRHIGRVTAEGLELTLPARHNPPGQPAGQQKFSLFIDEVDANEARLTTTPKDPSKSPLVFELHSLQLHRVGPEDAMSFKVEVSIPKPAGRVSCEGVADPWNATEPTDSPIEGKYTLHNADLGVFKGISGVLQSTGTLKGHLDSIEVRGTADVPDFALRYASHPVPLHTDFEATVDGTDGDTILHPVRARLGTSTFLVNGAIDKGAVEQRKTILLETKSVSGHLEDFLRLAMKSAKPPMTGGIAFQAIVKIPPGDAAIPDRLELDGSYELQKVRFTDPAIEQKVSSLSHHAEGDPKDTATGIEAAFNGHFRLRDSEMHLPDIRFRIPGAAITLAGTYQLRGGALDFTGTAKMDATVSEMTTGFKKVLLKPVDPLFKRSDAGAVVPIRISGTPGQPSFSFDIGRALRGK